jgi:hypothetical protein
MTEEAHDEWQDVAKDCGNRGRGDTGTNRKDTFPDDR